MVAQVAQQSVRVSCRFRPLNRIEREHGSDKCIKLSSSSDDGVENVVDIYHSGTGSSVSCSKSDFSGNPGSTFTVDRVFSDESTQKAVYEYTAQAQVKDALDGYNCTIFAYGQTGSGKTHTMMGPEGGILDKSGDENCQLGIIPRIAHDIFGAVEESDSENEFTVKVSFVEIYMERIRDLLNPSQSLSSLRIREDKQHGVSLEGAVEQYVSNVEEMLTVMRKGSASRAIASTRMNQDSSRSHSVFIITITQKDFSNSVEKTGKLTLVDLAGSEVVKKTMATATVLEEAKMINKSLSALGNVIKSLVEGAPHVPYRDSKLTRLLQDSLGGNSKTSLIITCSPSPYNVAETLSTLRFGQRAKQIKNKPKVNQEFSTAQYKSMLGRQDTTIQKLRSYIVTLENQLGISGTALDALGEAIMGTSFAVSSPVTPPTPVRVSDTMTSTGSPRTVQISPDSVSTSSRQLPSPSKGIYGQQPNGQGSGENLHSKAPENVTTTNTTVSSKSQEELLQRAEQALTVALETNDVLESKLEEKESETRVVMEALEGQRAAVAQLSSKSILLEQENDNLQEKLSELERKHSKLEIELQESRAGETLLEEQITVLVGLLESNNVSGSPIAHHEAFAYKTPSVVKEALRRARRLSMSSVTSQQQRGNLGAQFEQEHTESDSPSPLSLDHPSESEGDVVDAASETTQIGEDDSDGDNVSVRVAPAPVSISVNKPSNELNVSTQFKQQHGNDDENSSIGHHSGHDLSWMTDEDGSPRSGDSQVETTKEQQKVKLLERDLSVLTDKYVKLNFELVDAQEKLDTIRGSKESAIYDMLQAKTVELEESRKLQRVAEAKLKMAEGRERHASMKMVNRDQQIETLEETIKGFQEGFKEHTQKYQAQVLKLEHELAMYKEALDGAEIDQVLGNHEDANSTVGPSSEQLELSSVSSGSPTRKHGSISFGRKVGGARVVKPIRGGQAGR